VAGYGFAKRGSVIRRSGARFMKLMSRGGEDKCVGLFGCDVMWVSTFRRNFLRPVTSI
jgi:hypothetical protein